MQQALTSGAVDGAATLEPVVSAALAEREEVSAVACNFEPLPDQSGAVLVIREGLINEHPELVTALTDMQVRATDMLIYDTAAATLFVWKYVDGGRLDPAIAEAAIKRFRTVFEPDPNAIRGSSRIKHDFQHKIGTLSGAADLDTLFDTSFFDKPAAE